MVTSKWQLVPYIGIPNEQPLTLAVKELEAHEAQELLRSMANVPESHAAIIAQLCGD